MSIEILDCLKRERDICVKTIITSQNTAFMWTPALGKRFGIPLWLNISYRQMLIKRLTAFVFIFKFRECLLTMELHLTPVRFSVAVFFVKRAAESSAPIRNKLHFLNSNYQDNNKNGYSWNKTLHTNWKLTIVRKMIITHNIQSKRRGRNMCLTFIF